MIAPRKKGQLDMFGWQASRIAHDPSAPVIYFRKRPTGEEGNATPGRPFLSAAGHIFKRQTDTGAEGGHFPVLNFHVQFGDFRHTQIAQIGPGRLHRRVRRLPRMLRSYPPDSMTL
jgi:hypothetical protein